MAKKIATYRVDEAKLKAVGDKAAGLGLTVTDVIDRAFDDFLGAEAATPAEPERRRRPPVMHGQQAVVPRPVPKDSPGSPPPQPRGSAGTATAVFQPAGAEPVVTHPVPAKTAAEAREQLDRTVARKSAAKGQCEHRVKSGAYCKECGRLI